MPNTTPAMDTPAMIAWLRDEAIRHGLVEVLPTGCLTRGRAGQVVAFDGWRLAGRARATFFRGRIAWRDPALKIIDTAAGL